MADSTGGKFYDTAEKKPLKHKSMMEKIKQQKPEIVTGGDERKMKK